MKPISKLSGVLAAALVTMIVLPVTAAPPITAGQTTVTTDLTGYQETPLTINSAGSGEFTATIQDNGTTIAYQLTYRDLSSPATQAHIHFGRPAITGMIVLFLCANTPPITPPAGVPTPPPCPPAPATVTGTLTAADVIARPAQGIDPGAAGFAEMLNAIRAGAAYANVHTTVFPSGEIRGRLHSHGPGGE
jgi:hypothetical protein